MFFSHKKNSVKNFFIFCVGFMLLCVFSACAAQKKMMTIDITQGVLTSIPLIFPDLEGDEEERNIAEVIRHDLKDSGVFRLVPSKGIQSSQEIFATPSFAEWKSIEGSALCGGLVHRDGDDIVVNFRLYDVHSEKMVRQGSLRGPASKWRKIAHRVADAIYETLTGEAGYFDTQVVYTAESGSPTRKIRQISLADQDGHNARFYTSRNQSCLMPKCSPNGRHVVFCAFHGYNLRMHVLDLATGEDRYVPVPGIIVSPRFNHDGTRIIFCSAADGTTSVYSCGLRGESLHRLTKAPGRVEVSPSLSQDGQWMVFASDRGGGGGPKLYVMSVQGGTPFCISKGQGSYFAPSWSPDGKWIAFVKRYKGGYYLGVMAPDGSQERLLLKDHVVDSPTWAPNSRHILFAAQHRNFGPFHLYRVDFSGRFLRKIEVKRPGEKPHEANSPSWRMPFAETRQKKKTSS